MRDWTELTRSVPANAAYFHLHIRCSVSGMLPFTAAARTYSSQLGAEAVWNVAFSCASWWCAALAQNNEANRLGSEATCRQQQPLLSMFNFTGPAIIQISGMQPQPAPAAPEGRHARKQKVQPLTAELLNRLPSFHLASTSKARFFSGALSMSLSGI